MSFLPAVTYGNRELNSATSLHSTECELFATSKIGDIKPLLGGPKMYEVTFKFAHLTVSGMHYLSLGALLDIYFHPSVTLANKKKLFDLIPEVKTAVEASKVLISSYRCVIVF